jgi:RNA polymerase sigma factor (sigma-70 family)
MVRAAARQQDEAPMSEQPAEKSSPSPEVVAALVNNHREFLGFLERRLGDRSEAEDLLQEAFRCGLEKLEELHDDERVVAWFYRVLRNRLIDRARRQKTRAEALARLAHELEDPAQPELQNAACRCVAGLAETLKPEYRQALQRIELDGVSVKDYASEQAISSSNAAVRVFRARQALRKQVVESCGTCAAHGCYDCSCSR